MHASNCNDEKGREVEWKGEERRGEKRRGNKVHQQLYDSAKVGRWGMTLLAVVDGGGAEWRSKNAGSGEVECRVVIV